MLFDANRRSTSRSLAVSTLSDRCVAAYANNKGGTSRLTVTTFDASGVIATVDINTSSVTPNTMWSRCYLRRGMGHVGRERGMSALGAHLRWSRSLASPRSGTSGLIFRESQASSLRPPQT